MAEQTAEQTPPGAALHQRQTRSEVWKHFDLVSPKQTKYKKCDTCLTYNASTSTMIHHLTAVHGVTTKASDAGSKGLDAFVVSTPRSTTCSLAKSQKITDLLVDWIISDMRPLGIASDAGIQRLLDFLVPSRTHLTSLVKKRHVAARKELKEVLRTEGKFIALTTDGWTSKATEGYNTMTAHFIDSNWELRSCVLETSLFPGRHTAENIAEKVSAAPQSLDVPRKSIVAVVHDEAANMMAAGRKLKEDYGWESAACAAHLLQTCIRHSIEGTKAVLQF